MTVPINIVLMANDDGLGNFNPQDPLIQNLAAQLTRFYQSNPDPQSCSDQLVYPVDTRIRIALNDVFVYNADETWDWVQPVLDAGITNHTTDALSFCPNSNFLGSSSLWPELRDFIVAFEANHQDAMNIYFVEDGNLLSQLLDHISNGTEPAAPITSRINFSPFTGCATGAGAAHGTTVGQPIIMRNSFTAYFSRLRFGHIYEPSSPISNSDKAWLQKDLLERTIAHEIGHNLSLGHHINGAACQHLMTGGYSPHEEYLDYDEIDQLNRSVVSGLNSRWQAYEDRCGGSSNRCDLYSKETSFRNLISYSSFVVPNDIVIQSGHWVRIRDNAVLSFRQGAKIIMEPGSRLTIDGKLTSDCDKWQGITIADGGINSEPVLIEMGRAGIIEKAEVAIDMRRNKEISVFPPISMEISDGQLDISQGIIRGCDIGVQFGNSNYGFFGFNIAPPSTIDQVQFENCDVGIKFDRSNVVTVSNSMFQCDVDIEASASGFTADNCEFTSQVYVETTATSTYAPEIRNCDFVDAQLWLEHGFSLSTTIIEGNQFFCTDPSDGIYMLSENNATIRSNDFYGCDDGVYYENTGKDQAGNKFEANFFDYNYWATTAVLENDYEYLQNCFAGSARRDIDLVDARLFPTHGTLENSAGNCFSDFSQTNTGKAIRGTVIEEFTYHSKDAASGADNCKNPKTASSGEYVIDDSDLETDPSCGTNNYPYTIVNRYLYCNYQRGNYEDVITMIAAIEEQINEITNDDSLSPRVKRWLIARLKRCIDLWTRKSAKAFIEDGFTDQAINLLESRPEFRYKALAYGTILSSLDYNAAETFLLNLPATSTAETDYVAAQQIYLNYLRDIDGYNLSAENQSALLIAGHRSNTLSYASRSVYRLLTGEQITLPRRHSEETQERSAEIASDLAHPFDIYPNPVGDDILTIVTGNTDPYTVQVINVQGVLVSETVCVGDCELDLSIAVPGIHIVRVVQNGHRVHVQKIMRL